MKKKLLTVALAATMMVASVFNAFAASEELTGTAWWTGSKTGQDYAIKDGETKTFEVATKADTGAFSVELYNKGTDAAGDGYFFTTGSDGNGWVAELLTGTVKNPFADNGNADPKLFVAGNTLTVSVTRSGSTMTIKYADKTAAKDLYTITATLTATAPADMNVHFMAQVGTITVSQVTAAATATTAAGATTAAATATTKAAAGTATTVASKTGDNTASTVALVTVAAVGAMFVVLASRKSKVTE